MKISNNTLMILKWMSTINGGIHIEPGNEIYSKNEIDTVITVGEVEEQFPIDFITNNLQKFLAIVNLFDNPEFEFGDKEVIISSDDSRNKTVFTQSNEALVKQPNKVPNINIDDVSISFTLKSEDIKKIFKAASVMGINTFRFKADNGTIYLSTLNPTIKSSDVFDIIIGECDESISCVFDFSKSTFSLINDFDYEVQITSRGLAKFSCINSPFKKYNIFIVSNIDTNND